MPELTPEQRQAFDDRLRELGMDPSHVVQSLRTGDTPGPTYLSNHPDVESAIPHHPATIDNVDDLKRLAGVPDEEYEAGNLEHHHDPLEPWPEEKNEHTQEDLSPDENQQVHDALTAHVYGHSDRVASYKAVVNNNYFPMDAAAFAVLDVTVDPGHPLILTGNNQAHNYGTVTIKPGGQIIFDADATMTCQQMVLE
jgi:hypothetical protein